MTNQENSKRLFVSKIMLSFLIYEFYNKQHGTFTMEFLCSAVVDIESSINIIVNVKLEKILLRNDSGICLELVHK
jgi:hypothetical protein